MAEEKIPSRMREFVKTMGDGDVEKTLACFAEDGVWICPQGTFRGKDEIRRYLTAMYDQMKDIKVKECGNGIIAQGDKAFFEHEITGTMEGKKATVLAMCAYEFEDDKIKRVRSTFDRLLMAKQAAPGWFARTMVNFIINKMEAGLH